MSSLYIHIPFCRKACTYCDFHFSVNHDKIDDLVNAIAKEISYRKEYLKTENEPVQLKTIYFGGGTPSLLQFKHFEIIFNEINRNYIFSDDAEITLEANPDDLSVEYLRMLRLFPFNRLSIGVQSFFDDDLKFMNRTHDSHMAENCILDAANAGFDNLTIDLIYGVQGMSNEKWKQNLAKAFMLPVRHLSCYSLTVEKRTPLYKLINDGIIGDVSESLSATHFETLMIEAREHDFEHYEISNFAKNGMYSKHNSNYWNDQKYMGVGPSAHSYDGQSRQWNIASNAAYTTSIRENKPYSEKEVLTVSNKYNEYILTRLRTKWGVSNDFIRTKYGVDYEIYFLKTITQYIESGDLIFNNAFYLLTDKGKFIADRIAENLFIIDPVKT